MGEVNGMVHVCGKMQKGRNGDCEKWADVGGPLATWGHGEGEEKQTGREDLWGPIVTDSAVS